MNEVKYILSNNIFTKLINLTHLLKIFKQTNTIHWKDVFAFSDVGEIDPTTSYSVWETQKQRSELRQCHDNDNIMCCFDSTLHIYYSAIERRDV